MSALPPKADIDRARPYVRFVPKADIAPKQSVLQSHHSQACLRPERVRHSMSFCSSNGLATPSASRSRCSMVTCSSRRKSSSASCCVVSTSVVVVSTPSAARCRRYHRCLFVWMATVLSVSVAAVVQGSAWWHAEPVTSLVLRCLPCRTLRKGNRHDK
jgi:hypothetical protein